MVISGIIEEKNPQKSNVSRTNEKSVILIIGNLNHPNSYSSYQMVEGLAELLTDIDLSLTC